MWIVDDQQTDLDRIVLALVANRSNLQHFEYVLFQDTALAHTRIEIEQTPGDVLDPEIVGAHMDANVRDIDGLAQLAKRIWLSPTKELGRKVIMDLVQISRDAYNAGTFKQEYCKPNVFAELQRRWEQLPS